MIRAAGQNQRDKIEQTTIIIEPKCPKVDHLLVEIGVYNVAFKIHIFKLMFHVVLIGYEIK